MSYKVDTIINCQKKSYENYFISNNIKYLELEWEKNNTDTLWNIYEHFDHIANIFHYILSEKQVMFIFCDSYLYRSISFLILVLMKIFKWSFSKCIHYVKKKTEIEKFLNLFQNELLNIEKEMKEDEPEILFSNNWDSNYFGDESLKDVHDLICISFKNIEVIE